MYEPYVVAGYIMKRLESCERLSLTGEARRGLPQPKTIDILYSTKSPDLVEAALQELQQAGRLKWINQEAAEFQARGKFYRVNFYAVPLENWGVNLAIQTGPLETSEALKTSRAKGGLLLKGQRVENGALWFQNKVVDTPSEESFFLALGLPLLPCYERDLKALIGYSAYDAQALIEAVKRGESGPYHYMGGKFTLEGKKIVLKPALFDYVLSRGRYGSMDLKPDVSFSPQLPDNPRMPYTAQMIIRYAERHGAK